MLPPTLLQMILLIVHHKVQTTGFEPVSFSFKIRA